MSDKKVSKKVKQDKEEILNDTDNSNDYVLAVSMYSRLKKSRTLLVKLNMDDNTFEVVKDTEHNSMIKAATQLKLDIKNKILNQKV